MFCIFFFVWIQEFIEKVFVVSDVLSYIAYTYGRHFQVALQYIVNWIIAIAMWNLPQWTRIIFYRRNDSVENIWIALWVDTTIINLVLCWVHIDRSGVSQMASVLMLHTWGLNSPFQ